MVGKEEDFLTLPRHKVRVPSDHTLQYPHTRTIVVSFTTSLELCTVHCINSPEDVVEGPFF